MKFIYIFAPRFGKKTMNTYNIEERGCVFYHVIAESKEQVMELVKQNGYDITGMEITEERINVRDELGRPYKPAIFKEF